MQVEEYLGSVAEFLPEEIPTLKSVLRYGLFLQKKEVLMNEKSIRSLSYKKDMASLCVCRFVHFHGCSSTINAQMCIRSGSLGTYEISKAPTTGSTAWAPHKL